MKGAARHIMALLVFIRYDNSQTQHINSGHAI